MSPAVQRGYESEPVGGCYKSHQVPAAIVFPSAMKNSDPNGRTATFA